MKTPGYTSSFEAFLSNPDGNDRWRHSSSVTKWFRRPSPATTAVRSVGRPSSTTITIADDTARPTNNLGIGRTVAHLARQTETEGYRRHSQVMTTRISLSRSESSANRSVDFSVADSPDGGSFHQYLRQSGATRIQAARLFSVLLGNLAGSCHPPPNVSLPFQCSAAKDEYEPIKKTPTVTSTCLFVQHTIRSSSEFLRLGTSPIQNRWKVMWTISFNSCTFISLLIQ